MSSTSHPSCRPSWRRYRLTPALLAFALAIAGCDEAAAPTGPHAPDLLIRDAVHNYGNIHFYWLEPTVPSSPASFNGQANINFWPVIELCELSGDDCVGAPIAIWGRKSGTNGTRIYNSSVKQHYSLIAPTGNLGLDPAKTYRAAVKIMKSPVGVIDVDVVATHGELAGVDRTEYTPLLLGGSLTLVFRLEYGAIFPLSPQGGTLSVLDGAVTLLYPMHPLAGEQGIMIQPAHEDLLPVGETSGADRLAEGTAYEVGPEMDLFGGPTLLTIKYDEGFLPSGAAESELVLARVENGVWAEVPGSIVDENANTVSGHITLTGIYGVVRRVAGQTLSAGGYTSCALDAGGQAYCWGHNYYGQVGNGTSNPNSIVPSPVPVSGGLAFSQVANGQLHTCGVDTGGQAWCWGYGLYGALGNGSTALSSVPLAVSQGTLEFSSIAVGAQHACALTTGGSAYCWGRGFEGQLGNGTSSQSLTPVPVSGGLTFTALQSSHYHTCGVDQGGAAYCWGYNHYGELGIGGSYYQNGSAWLTRNVPTAVVGGLMFTDIHSGALLTCGVAASGAGYCWGYNYYGGVGNGASYQSFNGSTWSADPSQLAVASPAAVTGGHTFGRLVAGHVHACGITPAGDAHCWGYNADGQLGRGFIGGSPEYWFRTPAPVNSSADFAEIDAGYYHTCGRSTAGVVTCWGRNWEGEVGIGTTGAGVPTPSVVPIP